mmetsp:Transcript_26130/g.104559  ORF Transcript_26130/g.104559 Transcript_26130/m.104559 type:complete len:206 (-) Transcript_26130:639-1256(-)
MPSFRAEGIKRGDNNDNHHQQADTTTKGGGICSPYYSRVSLDEKRRRTHKVLRSRTRRRCGRRRPRRTRAARGGPRGGRRRAAGRGAAPRGGRPRWVGSAAARSKGSNPDCATLWCRRGGTGRASAARPCDAGGLLLPGCHRRRRAAAASSSRGASPLVRRGLCERGAAPVETRVPSSRRTRSSTSRAAPRTRATSRAAGSSSSP